MQIKRYVCFEEDGSIYKITNKPDDRFQNLEVDFSEVEDFITGKRSLLEHKVEFDFIEKKYNIKSQKQLNDDKLMWAFLYEIPTTMPEEKQIVITKNNLKKQWQLSIDEEFEKQINDQKITIDMSNYFFSVTKQSDPNVLYKLLNFDETMQLPFTKDFEFDDSKISVYTTRRFDSYYYEEINE
jgi:hypothetical protein